MGTSVLRKWECDNCDHTSLEDNTNLSPKGWAQLRWNNQFPLGAPDATGWHHIIICRECYDAIMALIKTKFNQNGEVLPKDPGHQFSRS